MAAPNPITRAKQYLSGVSPGLQRYLETIPSTVSIALGNGMLPVEEATRLLLQGYPDLSVLEDTRRVYDAICMSRGSPFDSDGRPFALEYVSPARTLAYHLLCSAHDDLSKGRDASLQCDDQVPMVVLCALEAAEQALHDEVLVAEMASLRKRVAGAVRTSPAECVALLEQAIALVNSDRER